MSETKNKCLVLNADYSPLKIINWRQALIIDFRNKNKLLSSIEIIDYHNNTINGTNDRLYKIPSIIRITKYMNIHRRNVIFSRKNLFIRDENTCQYCGIIFSSGQLTYDHIVPKCRFKPDAKKSTNWQNIVTSCRKCNAKKGNKTPKEAGMSLLRSPYAPKYDLKYLSFGVELHTIYNKPEYSSWKPFVERLI